MTFKSDTEADKEFYHVLGVLSEECAEIIQCISKIQRFGLDSFHPENPDLSNWERFNEELNDFYGTLQALENIVPQRREMFETDHILIDRKESKITMMLEISRNQGRL